MSDLFKHINYRAPIDYIISGIIREYDLKSANINVLRKAGAISEQDYTRYASMDKFSRERAIGILQLKRPEIKDILKEGITEARRLFFLHNNIEDYEVLSIKNDAIFVINKIAHTTDIGNGLIFVCKNEYTSFYYLRNKEFYYYFNPVDNREIIDIKGMSDENMMKHQDFFLDFITDIFYGAQMFNIEDVILILQEYHRKYINLELPIECYRRFDNMSRFEFTKISKYADFQADFISEDYKPYIDISYNLKIIMDLQRIIAGVYFQRKPFYK